MMEPLIAIDLPVELYKSGKVREMFDLGQEYLMVATDRISAFDHILPNGIPYKGAVLNQISLFWFDMVKGIIDNHTLVSDISQFPENLREFKALDKRAVVVKKAKPLPVECIVRGYLSGSGWKEYQQMGSVCGLELPSGLEESSMLPEPIFTPSTKAETGHDVNVSFEKAAEIVGEEIATTLQTKSLEIYQKAASYARDRGIIIADTKFEFGIYNDEVILIDEVLTPDSSRFWPLDDYMPGRPQKSFDKQYVRDYLLSINWGKEPPVPTLPADVIKETSRKYLEAYEKLTGKKLEVET